MNRAVRYLLFPAVVSAGSLGMVVARGSIDASTEGPVVSEVDRGQQWPGEFERAQAEPAERHGTLEAPEEDRKAPNEQADPLTGEERRARALERRNQFVELMTTTAALEAIDPDWSPAMERQIAERFAANAPPEFKLRSTTCKTSLCIAEVETPSREAGTGQPGWRRFFGFKRGVIHYRGEEDGSFRTVVFIARDGHRLPSSKRDSREAAVSPQTRPESPPEATNIL